MNVIDLARNALKDDEESQIRDLMRTLGGNPGVSYGPLWRWLPQLFDLKTNLPGLPTRQHWTTIERSVARLRQRDGGARLLEVLGAIHAWATENDVRAGERDWGGFSLGTVQEPIRCWPDLVLELDGKPAIPFVDPRKRRSCGSLGRHFVFSLQHHRLRARFQEFVGARLVVLHCPNDRVVMHEYSGEALVPFDELCDRIRRTHELREEARRRKQQKRLKRASGDDTQADLPL